MKHPTNPDFVSIALKSNLVTSNAKRELRTLIREAAQALGRRAKGVPKTITAKDRARRRRQMEKINAWRQLRDKSETRPQFIVHVKQENGVIVDRPMTCERSAEVLKRRILIPRRKKK